MWSFFLNLISPSKHYIGVYHSVIFRRLGTIGDNEYDCL